MESVCIICKKLVRSDDKCVVHNPRKEGLMTLILAAKKRQDECGQMIADRKDEILSGKIKIKFHKECRKNYTSAHNILPREVGNSRDDVDLQPGPSGMLRITRGKNATFDIRRMCFICNKSGTKNRKGLISIQTGTGQITYQKVIKAANERNDVDMTTKLTGYEDLFAYDAKYHKTCLSHYISARNIKAQKNRSKNEKKNLQVLNETVVNSSSSTSSSELDNVSDIFKCDNTHTNEDEMQILHRAAGILKKDMAEMVQENKAFPQPAEINSSTFSNQVPKRLLTFLSWLIDDTLYNSLDDAINSKAAIPSNIIMGLYNARYKLNGFQMGLGLYIYHVTRSRKIVNTLNQIGLTCSYDDIRQLLTSLAEYRIIGQDNIYVPAEINVVEYEKKNYIHASIDNFDLNEETVDGKCTTHSMAMVVFQPYSQIAHTNITIQKGGSYSLRSEETDLPFLKILSYLKPAIRPEPSDLKSLLPEVDHIEYDNIRTLNLTWKILRYIKCSDPFLSWTDYHNVLSSNKISVSKIAYLPFLNAPPTDYDTIFTSMVRLVELAEHLNQEHIVIAADLAIYSKAREILWNNPIELQGKVTLQLGGMHLNMALIASIGYIFGDGGLKSILVETDVFAENSCSLMLEGKQYSRAVRGLTLAADALSRLFFTSLNTWCEETALELPINDNLKRTAKTISEKLSSSIVDEKAFKCLLENVKSLEGTISKFVLLGSSSSATFKFWHCFLEAVDLLWRMLHAEREASFESHLCAVKDALPYLTAAGRNLYAKWVPVYLNDMQSLKNNVPHMYEFMAEGNFVVKKGNEKRFNCVASDMALEQSINRDCKSSGGIIGFSQNPKALLRWVVTRHTLGEYSQNFLDATSKVYDRTRKEGQSMKQRNETDVLKIQNAIEKDWCNPFNLNNVPSELINICTGKVADQAVEKSLKNFLESAKTIIETFYSNISTSGFWKPFKRDKVLTFKESYVKPKTKEQAFIGSELMFRRAICASSLREIDLSHILSHELTLIPTSLFHEDGSMRKTAKSDLAKKLENHTQLLKTCTDVESFIIDGMVCVQELREASFTTFNDLGKIFLKYIINTARKRNASRITVVFDNYDGNSIKDKERNRRENITVSTFTVTGTRKVPKFKDFLKSSENKRSLLVFLTNYIVEKGSDMLSETETVIIAGGFANPESVLLIRKREKAHLEELHSNHYEADTRLVLHALYESTKHSKILIKSVDTDVLILLLHYYNVMSNQSTCELFVELGHSNSKRFIDVGNLSACLGRDICLSLLSMHCLTGCDTTSAFYKIGKRTAFDILMKNFNSLKRLSEISVLPEEEAQRIATQYVLLLYKNKNPHISTLNELRYHLTQCTNRPASELPPTDDAFLQHLKRSIYQLKIWHSSHVAHMSLDSPQMHGWNFKNGIWEPTFTTQPAVPESVRQLLSIQCSDKNCNNARCHCLKNGFKCCSECSCKNCNNKIATEMFTTSSDSEDDA